MYIATQNLMRNLSVICEKLGLAPMRNQHCLIVPFGIPEKLQSLIYHEQPTVLNPVAGGSCRGKFLKMSYLREENNGIFTMPSSGNNIIASSMDCLQMIFCGGIQQHADDPLRLVCWLAICGIATFASLPYLHEFLHELLNFSSFLFTILVWYFVASLATFGLYYLDKITFGRVQREYRNVLHCLHFIGGWPGDLAAQKLLRHEVRGHRNEPGFRHQIHGQRNEPGFKVLVALNVILLIVCVEYNCGWIIGTLNAAFQYVNVAIHNLESNFYEYVHVPICNLESKYDWFIFSIEQNSIANLPAYPRRV
ncbi:hypothetical protein DdX_17001 [Ditylenchus destructor]|uniref:Uncharacterized protein n=1 Tax=Ditylenchus destructor TaxID=166010 RepID=A0AAD4MN27_9BILA|nr:hypothetical protein DdX_17001 [Ditylenchus destructor]